MGSFLAARVFDYAKHYFQLAPTQPKLFDAPLLLVMVHIFWGFVKGEWHVYLY